MIPPIFAPYIDVLCPDLVWSWDRVRWVAQIGRIPLDLRLDGQGCPYATLYLTDEEGTEIEFIAHSPERLIGLLDQHIIIARIQMDDLEKSSLRFKVSRDRHE